jgi:diphthamide biosynthesis protein 4
MDAFQVLGIDSTCTLEEIKAAYYKLAREYHPDKSSGQDNSSFLRIQEAWEFIRKQETSSMLGVMSDLINIVDLRKIDESMYSYPCRCGCSYEVSQYRTFLSPDTTSAPD